MHSVRAYKMIFVLKLPNFRFHGNNGRSSVDFGDIVKLPDLHNPPPFGATSLSLSLILAEF